MIHQRASDAATALVPGAAGFTVAIVSVVSDGRTEVTLHASQQGRAGTTTVSRITR